MEKIYEVARKGLGADNEEHTVMMESDKKKVEEKVEELYKGGSEHAYTIVYIIKPDGMGGIEKVRANFDIEVNCTIEE